MDEGAKTVDVNTFIYAETTSCGMGCRILQRDVIGKRKKIIEFGWRAAGITDAICLGSKPPIDPFHDIERQIWYVRVEADNEGDEGDEGDESD